MREQLYELVSPPKFNNSVGRAYAYFMVIVAALSLIPMMFRTENLSIVPYVLIKLLDILTAYILLFDYAFRWVTHDIKTGKGIRSLILYPFTPLAIIQLLAILPTLGLLPQTFRFLRILRVLNLFRYSRHLVSIHNVFVKEYKTLGSIVVIFCVYLSTVALIMYLYDSSVFTTYLDALLWSTTQLTSASLTGLIPQSNLARAISVLTTLMAFVIVALPAGVIAGAYVTETQKSESRNVAHNHLPHSVRKSIRQFVHPSQKVINNLKLKRYLLVFRRALVFAILSSVLLTVFGVPLSFDHLAVACVAILLEPVAGVLFGLVCATVVSILALNPVYVLYALSYAFTALVCGFLYQRDGAFTLKNTLIMFVLLLFGGTVIEFGGILYLSTIIDSTLFYSTLEKIAAFFPFLQNLSDASYDYIFAVLLANQALVMVITLLLCRLLVSRFAPFVAPTEEEILQDKQQHLDWLLRNNKLDEENDYNYAAKDLTQRDIELDRKIERIEKRRNVLKKEIQDIEKRLEVLNEPLPPVTDIYETEELIDYSQTKNTQVYQSLKDALYSSAYQSKNDRTAEKKKLSYRLKKLSRYARTLHKKSTSSEDTSKKKKNRKKIRKGNKR